MTDENPFVTASGVTSEVKDDSDGSLGHILILDYDGDWTLDEINEEVSDFSGISVLLETSEGNYHYWNLGVRNVNDVLQEGLYSSADLEHLRQGFRRGKWVSRFSAKEHPDGDTYKEQPELVYAWAKETLREQSLPHWDFVKKWWDVPTLYSERDYRFDGDQLTMEKYRTFTDTGKLHVLDGYTVF